MKKKFLKVVSALMAAVMLMLVPGVSAFALEEQNDNAVVAQSERPSDAEMFYLLIKILAEGFSGENRMDSQDLL